MSSLHKDPGSICEQMSRIESPEDLEDPEDSGDQERLEDHDSSEDPDSPHREQVCNSSKWRQAEISPFQQLIARRPPFKPDCN